MPTINTRAAAWDKLARLCAVSTRSKVSTDNSLIPDSLNLLLSKLTFYNSNQNLNNNDYSKIKNTLLSNTEIQVLFALCKNCSKFKEKYQIDLLFTIFSKYFVFSQFMSFNSISLFVNNDLTPWTKLTYELSLALINLTITSNSKFNDTFYNILSDYILNLDKSKLYHQFSLLGLIQSLTFSPNVIDENIFNLLMSVFNQDFFDLIEKTITNINDQNDIDLIYSFNDLNFEYSSLFFIDLIERFQLQYLKNILHSNSNISLMEFLLNSKSISYSVIQDFTNIINYILKFQFQIDDYITNSNDRILNSTFYRRKTCLLIHAFALEIYSLNIKISNLDTNFLNKKITNYLSEFMVSIEEGSPIALDIITSNLLLNTFGAGAILSEENQSIGLNIVKHFPIIVQTIVMPKDLVKKLSLTVKYCLKSLSKDDLISLIYTLINMINNESNNKIKNNNNNNNNGNENIPSTTSSIIDSYMTERNDLIPQNIITSIVEITKSANDESIITLVTTLLYQKIVPKSDELNCILLDGLTEFIDNMNKKDFGSLLKYYYDVSETALKDTTTYKLNIETWTKFSEAMSKSSNEELYNVYLNGLLFQIISKGDIDDLEHHRPNQSVTESAKEITLFLKPLAHLLPPIDEPPRIPKDKETISKFQNAWFNLSVHGFAYNSTLYKNCLPELLRIAHSTPPLASEFTWNRSETSIEMNTILRRGTSKTTEKLHKDVLKNIISLKISDDGNGLESQISRPGLMFLSSSLMVEMLRVETGNCSTILDYMSDPSVIIARLNHNVGLIAQYCCTQYSEKLIRNTSSLTMSKLTNRLKKVFVACCHRDNDLQNCAFRCADIILTKIPSSLCYDESTFALLDILALLFQSIIDADTNEYEPMTKFKSRVTDIDLLLSDSYSWRQQTLDTFSNHATKWICNALKTCDGDMKTVLRSYVTKADASHRTINYGVSFALDMASKILPNDREFFQLQSVQSKKLNTTAGFLAQAPWHSSIKLLQNDYNDNNLIIQKLDEKIESFILKLNKTNNKSSTHHEFTELIEDLSRFIIVLPTKKLNYLKSIADLPFLVFDSYSIEHAIPSWLNIIKEKPEFASSLLSFILQNFENTVIKGIGLYSRENDLFSPEFNPMEYLPTNKISVTNASNITSAALKPHLLLIRFLSSHFHATLYQNDHILNMFTETLLTAIDGLKSASLHPYSRLARFELVYLGCELLKYYMSFNSEINDKVSNTVLDGALSWFVKDVATPFGNNKLKIKADFEILNVVANFFHGITFKKRYHEQKRVVLQLFLDNEINLLGCWIAPLGGQMVGIKSYANYKFDERVLRDCYLINGKLAVNLVLRYEKNGSLSSSVTKTLRECIIKDPFSVTDMPEAVNFITDADVPAIVAWSSAAPVDAINKFLPPYNRNSLVLQYAMRSIESFDVHLTFFYVPQIVQTMRHDDLGYIRRFILETANVSQLFAHQIIWNMAANSFKDEESTIPDSIKPTLDEIRETMIKTFSDKDRAYFEKEFSFFGEVTGISGKLKPFIKKSKPEKKAKIDEEMSKIKVEEGVYLPSNPDGIVVDIDRKSGKPLQSHAKAPFLATFFIKKKKDNLAIADNNGNEPEGNDEDENYEQDKYEIVKTSAIFKVGDDCRQDVLALQLISIFRTIWMTQGVDVYVFPYRVTATAPGCGIIDVLPNSISRDMLGREAVNGLFEYFISQFGPETSPEFQRARINFVKSLAAYSIITYILAIKDRHNGNIMYDNEGHILHIDFGFCFDIVPGGVKFEQSPFKLTREMVRVMGGNVNTQAYKWFEELCVKCFLACRLHMNAIIDMVIPMLESGLPCFKAATIKHLTQRFVPNKNNREAAIYMRGLIRKSFESFATKGYDEFQRLTNGIPY